MGHNADNEPIVQYITTHIQWSTMQLHYVDLSIQIVMFHSQIIPYKNSINITNSRSGIAAHEQVPECEVSHLQSLLHHVFIFHKDTLHQYTMSLPSTLPPHILHALHSFFQTSSIRSFLYTLNRTAHHYCVICSHRPSPTPCAPTCPLLRPVREDRKRLCPVWQKDVMRDQQLYRALVADIRRHGDTASAERMRRWEESAEMLRVMGLTEIEKCMEGGWTGFDIRGALGMDLAWEFDKRWRVRVEEEVFAPDEGIVGRGVKKRREMEDGKCRENKRIKIVHEKGESGKRVVKQGKRKAKELNGISNIATSAKASRKRVRDVDEAGQKSKRARRA
jgi:hypothetical protein